MRPLRILLVDDEENIRTQLGEFLRGRGYAIQTAAGIGEAADAFEASAPDVALLDVRMPDGDGLSLAREFLRRRPKTVILMMTAFGTIEKAVEAMRSGVHDYLLKPIGAEVLLHKLTFVADKLRAEHELSSLRGVFGGRTFEATMVGASSAMQEVRAKLEAAARQEQPALLVGETGTGKELAARALHLWSKRRDGPFVVVDCAAVPTTLAESELFGHTKGAFTGASTSRPGRIVSAEGGTLFIDELSAAAGGLQAKLLRVLEERVVTAVGADRERPVDVRIVAATNLPPEVAVERGLLRADLFYRLNVWRIDLPPLRQRREDVLALAEHFITRTAADLDRPAPRLSEAAKLALARRAWPGNVRQLRNVIAAAVALAGDVVEPTHLPPEATREAVGTPVNATPGALPSLRQAIETAERAHIVRALDACDGVRHRAAELLGIDDRSLRRKVRKYEIDRHTPTRAGVKPDRGGHG